MGRRGPSLDFLLSFRQLEGGNRLNEAASPTGPGLLCYHGDSHQGTQLSHPSVSHPLGLRRPTLPPCGQMYDDMDSQTWRLFVIEIGETEAQRHRRNWLKSHRESRKSHGGTQDFCPLHSIRFFSWRPTLVETKHTQRIVVGKKLVGGIKRSQASGMEKYQVAGPETPDCNPNRREGASPLKPHSSFNIYFFFMYISSMSLLYCTFICIRINQL